MKRINQPTNKKEEKQNQPLHHAAQVLGQKGGQVTGTITLLL